MVHAANNCLIFLGFAQVTFKSVAAILCHFMSYELSIVNI